MMSLRTTVAVLAGLLLSSLPSHPVARVQAPSRPSLLVVLVIDQMRSDYLARFDAFWKRGVRRLLDDGAVYEETYYPYLNTVTCVGHATISTGSFPSTHGIILNEWWQRAEGRRRSCTDDPDVSPLPYGAPAEKIGHSAHRLRVPTLGDRLREQSPGSRVVTISMKPRSAVMLAGRGGVATWFSDADTWATSTAFAPAAVPGVAAFVQANPVENARNITWRRLYETPLYDGDDEAAGERPRAGWTNTFPHALSEQTEKSVAQFYDRWLRSPYSDAYIGEMAAALVQSFALGQREAVDLLAISFSGLDYVGHDFGPDSHEAQDTLFRLDRVIGDLFDVLDKTVGKDKYVVGVSADHGVAPIPEQRLKNGLDAGRVLPPQVRSVANKVLAPLGEQPYLAYVEYTDVYFTDATRTRLAARPDLQKAFIEALTALPGVERVFPGPGLEHKRESADKFERAAALSYVPGQSGDIIMVPKPFWILTDSAAATHGTLHPYDQHVPLIFMGRPFVKAGRYRDPASPADLAPTLAALIGLPMAGVDGQVLQSALSR
jgi:predicted AlkP superfamily pyrophosphatase or phosphodiesterase